MPAYDRARFIEGTCRHTVIRQGAQIVAQIFLKNIPANFFITNLFVTPEFPYLAKCYR